MLVWHDDCESAWWSVENARWWSRPMAIATAPSPVRLSPTTFCERLLSANALDNRADARECAQQALLLRPFLEQPVAPEAFETSLEAFQARNSDLAAAAREALALWRLCNR
jgi:hypothetical protein